MQRYGFASAPISNGGYMSISLFSALYMSSSSLRVTPHYHQDISCPKTQKRRMVYNLLFHTPLRCFIDMQFLLIMPTA